MSKGRRLCLRCNYNGGFNGTQWWFNGFSMGLNGTYDGIAAGKHSQFATLKMAIEIVDRPISIVIFHSFLYVYQAG